MGPPKLNYKCQLYAYLCQVWQDLSVFVTGLVRFKCITSERQNRDLAKLILTADQINLHLLQFIA
jgi:hypothetical protein